MRVSVLTVLILLWCAASVRARNGRLCRSSVVDTFEQDSINHRLAFYNQWLRRRCCLRQSNLQKHRHWSRGWVWCFHPCLFSCAYRSIFSKVQQHSAVAVRHSFHQISDSPDLEVERRKFSIPIWPVEVSLSVFRMVWLRSNVSQIRFELARSNRVCTI